MKKITYILFIWLAVAGITTAQNRYVDNVKFENFSGNKVNEQLQINMDILLDDLNLKSNDMLILTPVLYSNTGAASLELPHVVTLGNKRNKVYIRNKKLRNSVAIPAQTKVVMPRENKTSQTINYTASVPFHDWMQNASLSIKASVQGCADCGESLDDLLLVDRVISEPYKPNYKLTYIVPEVEPIKIREDRHTATFNYIVAKHDLLRNYKNNANELDRVDKVITEVKNNKDLNITEFTIAGYASPEGNFESNRTLADRRANSFADYLSNTHGIKRNQFKVRGYGEDWEGLKNAVEKSSLADKNEILRIIRDITNPDARDAHLMRLSGGATYRNMLNNLYPPLRRTDYAIAYSVRPFNVEEAKEIIKTNPKLLSLNEMYLVAQTYPTGGKEFKEVFDIAARMFPNEPVAIVNSAATDIEGGNYQAAIDRMNKMESNPRMWNNLGVAYALLGNKEKAKEYFDKAVANKDIDAVFNAEELKKTEK